VLTSVTRSPVSPILATRSPVRCSVGRSLPLLPPSPRSGRLRQVCPGRTASGAQHRLSSSRARAHTEIIWEAIENPGSFG